MTRSRNRRLRLIPSHLPLIRDKLAEYERVALKEEMAAHSQYERSMETAWNFADNLAVAQLWWISRDMTALAEDTVRAGDFPKRATGLSVWPFPPMRPKLSHDSLANVGVVRCSVRIPARVCGSRPPWASYRPWHCAWACRIFRRIHCGGRSARSPVTLACRTGTSWPQAGGTVRRCSTITTCPVVG